LGAGPFVFGPLALSEAVAPPFTRVGFVGAFAVRGAGRVTGWLAAFAAEIFGAAFTALAALAAALGAALVVPALAAATRGEVVFFAVVRDGRSDVVRPIVRAFVRPVFDAFGVAERLAGVFAPPERAVTRAAGAFGLAVLAIRNDNSLSSRPSLQWATPLVKAGVRGRSFYSEGSLLTM
jgi:hypothetical protein